MSAYLVVLRDRKPLAWVLSEERMGFTAARLRQGLLLKPGDELLLYTPRGCWHNPAKDRGRVVGQATVLDELQQLADPLDVAGVVCTSTVQFRLNGLCPWRTGVELAPMAGSLDALPDRRSWSARLRTTLLRLSDSDADRIRGGLAAMMRPPGEVLGTYLENATGPRESRRDEL